MTVGFYLFNSYVRSYPRQDSTVYIVHMRDSLENASSFFRMLFVFLTPLLLFSINPLIVMLFVRN